MTAAYPLQWPQRRPRKSAGGRKRASFGKKVNNGRYQETKDLTVADALGRLQDELDRIGARYPVVSTNLEPRLDGRPRSGQAEPRDPGVALYFDLAGKPHCMPCDTYDRVADNIAAIAKHIEATRAIERYGVANMSEMFAGFTALPAPSARRSWREVFGFGPTEQISASYLNERFRAKSKAAHPDVPGGSTVEMAELNQARTEALKEIGA
ncbi:hypothetical protein GGQ99_004732 [Aminobacter niigataensis]|uniref:J domain-containing protein n=1 Tax=Aminobacter niigataensis TaxID=83265 RepID=A0ABR6L8M1_9HYPH|nr:J domain-containing protein [Aminobacter niigataensis]MBB4652948.1 hypothetical protein [Aminobacter niigataensis]